MRVRPAPPYEPTGAAVVAVADGRGTGSAARPRALRPGQVAAPARKTAAAAVEARRFTIAVSRLLFEVIDRRRSAAHLGDVAAPAVVDQIAALVRHDAFRTADARDAESATAPVPGVGGGTVLQRVHVQLCHISAAEVFGTYSSGGRVRAFAGRIERKPCRVRGGAQPGRRSLGQVEYRWQLVALEFN
ncbi:hypothetical protein GDN83_17910 [Gordonia jinghuaiqii]|uniref:Uncharacterized protein n=1 Tax=Gordonia jinghuaiqii TaxID=2758710 RepID=A0A7D7LST1_9ACTN|nr:Rv3235 family protein [Gordonia jinghuaiqii]MCR5979589.1 hypothetical protein [Gordonia jinghuaiqii]QMT00621.1 hypothetical protein H1R19_17225 [Gordonia jinghuaiqii]